MAFDPYENHGANLMNSARVMLPITPSDTDDLLRVCKSIRIWNAATTPSTVTFTTVGGSVVTITVPANSVWTEPAVIVRVHDTGTTPGLELHGYTD
jgi:hypothetical protein